MGDGHASQASRVRQGEAGGMAKCVPLDAAVSWLDFIFRFQLLAEFGAQVPVCHLAN